ncbi:WecB/TagA/CpsF family glycosyltransferase [Halolactibacillus miurensis]|uniref:N-acetylglucosaminyldiphosphoundecaprenol N-acetyl-beta-D-mannosaminyltransferase n=1 Tax=Halolactibacillus miurensis TaxID=306541 RepID=A0A1I6UJJ2_9BACI|nr:WecB/TagA/CpsF family glycosyltransferase [Halolactibacillus miurensis]SFT01593.1 N-acetylglucosaminyldiphosphoundecaprenol N-acetyl-beta-D-mannosaminyltransferase [Halolactibacillus miurensis]
MNDKIIRILDVPFNNITKKECVNEIVFKANEEEKYFIVTANPEILMIAYDDIKYKHTIQQADCILPDGIGIVMAAKLNKEPMSERVAGFDLMTDLLRVANSNRMSCFFFGADQAVNQSLIKNIESRYPGIIISGFQHGYLNEAEERILINEINEKQPDFIFVALGAPKQEFWISKNLHLFKKGIFIGVGGSFDVLSGKVKRAPQLWIKYHLEWLYRIITDLKRLRRLPKILRFVFLIIKEKSLN